MSEHAETLPPANRSVSPEECFAIRLLAQSGWSTGELKMTMQVNAETVRRHRDGHCNHLPPWPAFEWSDDDYAASNALEVAESATTVARARELMREARQLIAAEVERDSR